MNQTAISLAQVRFQSALHPGPSTVPVSLSRALTQFNIGPQLHAFDAEAVGHSIDDEFPFLRNMIVLGTPPDSVAAAAWEEAIRWVLNSLRNWDSNDVNSLYKLRALLSAIAALDANHAGFTNVATQIDSNQLTAGLIRIIDSAEVRSGFNDGRFPELKQQIEAMVDSNNLEELWQLTPHMRIFPTADFWTAVVFLNNAAPALLASVVEKRDDVFFSLSICTVLEAQAITLASQVNNLVFKFVCVANFWEVERTAGLLEGSQNTLQALLLQVARTSAADWEAWMQALFKAPGNFPSLDAALAAVLQQLSQAHWKAFFEALSLSYSHRAAAPVANILVQFSQSAGTAQRDLMWTTAYQLWSDWNYGQDDRQGAMFAPVSCALDFPVAMYYACRPFAELIAEENRLRSAIGLVEQQWFNSATDLITERNRLKSRLRLVQHAIELTKGGSQALPSSIQPDTDLYAKTRYHYHDVNML